MALGGGWCLGAIETAVFRLPWRAHEAPVIVWGQRKRKLVVSGTSCVELVPAIRQPLLHHRHFRATEIPTTPREMLHIPLRETVGAINVLIWTVLRVASREMAVAALRTVCEGEANQRLSSSEAVLGQNRIDRRGAQENSERLKKRTSMGTYRSPGQHLEGGCAVLQLRQLNTPGDRGRRRGVSSRQGGGPLLRGFQKWPGSAPCMGHSLELSAGGPCACQDSGEIGKLPSRDDGPMFPTGGCELDLRAELMPMPFRLVIVYQLNRECFLA